MLQFISVGAAAVTQSISLLWGLRMRNGCYFKPEGGRESELRERKTGYITQLSKRRRGPAISCDDKQAPSQLYSETDSRVISTLVQKLNS